MFSAWQFEEFVDRIRKYFILKMTNDVLKFKIQKQIWRRCGGWGRCGRAWYCGVFYQGWHELPVHLCFFLFLRADKKMFSSNSKLFLISTPPSVQIILHYGFELLVKKQQFVRERIASSLGPSTLISLLPWPVIVRWMPNVFKHSESLIWWCSTGIFDEE